MAEATKQSKSPKLLCLYMGVEKKTEITTAGATLGYENASEFVRSLFDVAGGLTRAQVGKLRAKAKARGITPAELVAQMVG